MLGVWYVADTTYTLSPDWASNNKGAPEVKPSISSVVASSPKTVIWSWSPFHTEEPAHWALPSAET